MTHKLVLRLLGPDRLLMGWTVVEALSRGDGALWAPAPVVLQVDSSGMAESLSIHWCDLNIETVVPLPEGPHHLIAGMTLTLPYHTRPLLTLGVPPTSLPPVTVRSPVQITIPTGSMAPTGQKPH